MRKICDRCGTLSAEQNGAEHDGCPVGDGHWQPFPDLPGQLAVDLVCQQLTSASEDEAFSSVMQIWKYFDLCVWGRDDLIARLRDICAYRLETGRWQPLAVTL